MKEFLTIVQIPNEFRFIVLFISSQINSLTLILLRFKKNLVSVVNEYNLFLIVEVITLTN